MSLGITEYTGVSSTFIQTLPSFVSTDRAVQERGTSLVTCLPLSHTTPSMSRALGSAGAAKGSIFESSQSVGFRPVNGMATANLKSIAFT